MKKMIFLAALIFTAVFPPCTYADITPKEPDKINGCYNIASAENLYWFADYCKNAESTDDVEAKLVNDIVINEGGAYSYSTDINEWEPIMDFNGKFDGGGHSITGLYVKDKEYAGLFGSTGQGASLDGIVIDKSYIEGTKYVGAVVGHNKSNILYRCENKGTVVSYTDGACVGGIAGWHSSSSNFAICKNYGDVTGTEYTGGILGMSERSGKSLRELENYGNVRGGKCAGGIIGTLPADAYNNTVANCLNRGSVSAAEKAGGIVGFSDYYMVSGTNGKQSWASVRYNSLKSCCSTGWLSAEKTYGITGHTDGKVQVDNCCYLQWTANDKTISPVTQGPIGEEFSYNEFASGKAAYFLNGEITPYNSVWRQTIGTDAYPYLNDSTHGRVFRNITTGEYSNTEDELHKTCRILGNTDGSRSVDILDVIQILKKADNSSYIMPIETSQYKPKTDGVFGDIDGSGTVTKNDAKMLLGIIEKTKIDTSVDSYVFNVY